MNFHVPPASAGLANTNQPALSAHPAPGQTLMVHVVDDDEAVSRSLALLLVSFGIAAKTYESAEALLDQIDALEPGCLVIDVRMPGMDGLELHAELQERGCTMPVVIVTGHADVGSVCYGGLGVCWYC